MDSLTRSFELLYKCGINPISTDMDHIFFYLDEMRRNSKLILDMLKLISMMVDYYRYYSTKYSDYATSFRELLFFFSVDDLDMAPSLHCSASYIVTYANTLYILLSVCSTKINKAVIKLRLKNAILVQSIYILHQMLS